MKSFQGRFVDEVFTVVFIYFSAVFAAHFFYRFGLFLNKKLFVSPDNQETAAYFILILAISLIYPVIKEGWGALMKMKLDFAVNVWFQAIICGIKSYLVAGIIFLGILISQVPLLVNHANSSVSNILFRNVVWGSYLSFYHTVIKGMVPQEPRNERLHDIISNKRNLKSEPKKDFDARSLTH